ncbi:hypothetical protein OC834_007200 [Tilletia horrida]|nr:hypothetical protein OC834_007200 [Tilletia horrida]
MSDCDNNFGCAEGTCQSGRCQFLPDGAACIDSYMCSSGDCDESGNCSPTGVGANSVCSSSASCASGLCLPAKGGAGNPAGGGKCSKSFLGDPCVSPLDCDDGEGVCYNNRCRRSAGQPCFSESDCDSGFCTNKRCGKPKDALCSASKECRSKSCVDGLCQGAPVGGTCTAAADCASGVCNKTTKVCQAKATTTTTTATKSTSTSKTTSKTATTPLPSAAKCTTNNQCRSGYCRKPLLGNGDGATRAPTGTCDTKKRWGRGATRTEALQTSNVPLDPEDGKTFEEVHERMVPSGDHLTTNR